MELPRLEPLWKKYGEKGLSVIAIEAVRDTERAKSFIDENELSYHLLENDENNDVVRETFGVRSFPTSFLIDDEGRIMYCHVGFEAGDEEQLEKEILHLAGH
ncbi:MAG: TlpA family protein disulfide reductase [Candidatus Latescibacterota bacterium]|nr:MAG: TlpA family protein disulfide reductase [Candidatus Latescibacterota bacterium]